MAIPSSTVNFLDGNLGLVASAPTKPLIIGPCSSGTTNYVYTFGNISTLRSTLGNGPAATQAAMILNDVGGTVDVIRCDASVAATSGSFVSGTVPSVVLSGTPRDTYHVDYKIVTGGALSSDGVRVKYSLDGGKTYTAALHVTASTGVLSLTDTGLTLTFGAGTYTAGEVGSFVTHAPTINSTDLNAAMDAFKASGNEVSDIYVANDPITAAEGRVLASAMDTNLTSLGNLYQYVACVMHLGGQGDSDATKVTQANQFSFSTGQGGMLTVHRARRVLPITYPGYANPRLPFSMHVAAHTQARDLSSSPAAVRFGALLGASEPTYDEYLDGELFSAAGLVAPRTYRGRPGVFVTQALLKSPSTSDYKYYPWQRVLNRAATIVQERLEFYINSSVPVVKDGTGNIDPVAADQIEADVNGALRAELINITNGQGGRGHCSDLLFAVDRTTDVLSTSTLTATCAVIPFANISNITTNLFFTREINA